MFSLRSAAVVCLEERLSICGPVGAGLIAGTGNFSRWFSENSFQDRLPCTDVVLVRACPIVRLISSYEGKNSCYFSRRLIDVGEGNCQSSDLQRKVGLLASIASNGYLGLIQPASTDVCMKTLRVAVAALILASSLFAQNEGRASLTIRFAGGTNRFHVGEIVPLELSFQATGSDTYGIDMRSYDRSGRLNIEQFHVTPAGRDPLTHYFSLGVFMGGGLGSSRVLSSTPIVIRDELNEWVVLDQPGHFSVYVTSRRVSRESSQNEHVELQSNSLEFDIDAADPAWLQQELDASLAVLKRDSSSDTDRTAARRVLRFLDTPASVHELVVLLGTSPPGNRWDEAAGLAGSRHSALVVQELEQQMSAPNIALSRDYLQILAKLKFQLDHGDLPPYPQKDTDQQKAWNEKMLAYTKGLNELQNSVYDQAAALAATKEAVAKAETLQALLLRPSNPPSGDHAPPASLPPDVVAATFLNLSPTEQWNMLSMYWYRIKEPAMLVPLKKIAEQPYAGNPMLRDQALRRLYELDPAQAAPIFLEEMQHPHLDNGRFTVKIDTLGLLPNETLPQFDEMLASRIEDKQSGTRDLDSQLIGRYSTSAILPRVKAVYETNAGRWDCVTEDGFVRYFLRVDSDYGIARLTRAPSVCMVESLPAAVRMHRWSEVEPSIIASLNDPYPYRARQAAEALAKYGSPEAEKALWERMRKFHEQWSGRGDELAMRPGMKQDANEAVGFQYGLVRSIGAAQAWLVTNDEITELENLTLGQERENVKQWHWSEVRVNASFVGDTFLASANQYVETDIALLVAKLAQYPSGTRILLSLTGSTDRIDTVRAAILKVAADHNFGVTQKDLATP